MVLALLSSWFQSLPPLPTSKVGPSGADSQVGGFVYILGPCGSLQQSFPVRLGEFLWLPYQPPQVFSISGLRLYFPTLEPWVTQSVSLPSCSSRLISMWKWDHQLHQPPPHWVHQLLPCLAGQLQPCPPHSTIHHLAGSSNHHLATCPLRLAAHLHPSYWFGWMFLLYLLGCQISIQFDFLSVLVVFVFKLLLSFWLCEEVQCIPLHLHLDRKSYLYS